MASSNLAKISQRTLLQLNGRAIIKCNVATKSNVKSEDTKTHTGQNWDADDYRNCRFVQAPKQVNKNWGIKLVNEIPSKQVKDRVVWCNGGGGALGHPKVYINLDVEGEHRCGYCGLRFHKEQH